MTLTLLVLAALFLAYNNGANDNFKGVATLYASNVLGYRSALALATVATFLGSVGAIFLANGLIASFSGKNLVPNDVAGAADFLITVGLGAGFTVLLATRIGMPISTTHALVGALVGTGIAAQGSVNFGALGGSFVLPLLVSPLIAFTLGFCLYWLLNLSRKKLGLTKESCVCIGDNRQYVPIADLASARTHPGDTDSISHMNVLLADETACRDIYTGTFFGVSLQKILDQSHIVSAAAVSFARGLNDTPKIAGLLVAAQALDIQIGMLSLALAMAIGGLLNAKRVAITMSKKISSINHSQGFAANLITSVLVIFASRYGVPVSTTHVSIGSIFGVGVVSQDRNPAMIRNIILSWVITLPLAAILSASIHFLMRPLMSG